MHIHARLGEHSMGFSALCLNSTGAASVRAFWYFCWSPWLALSSGRSKG